MSILLKKLSIIPVVVVLLLCKVGPTFSLSQLTKNDPYPMFTSHDPFDYLYRYQREKMQGFEPEVTPWPNIFFSMSAFRQSADIGKNFRNEDTPLGDMEGRWSMMGLLVGQLPHCKTLPPALATAKAQLCCPDGSIFIDPFQQTGFFTQSMVYRKSGLRFDLQAQITNDFGFEAQWGVSDICFTVTHRLDLTCIPRPTCSLQQPTCGFVPPIACDCLPCGPLFAPETTGNALVRELLTCNLCEIADQICLDLCHFHKGSVEDLRLYFYWRHAIRINEKKEEEDWAHFLLIPFFNAGFSAGIAKKQNPNKAYSLPFGNNGHNSIGFQAGINFDFAETVEVGFHIGETYFFGNDRCLRVPNSECQSGIYPFSTLVHVQPGHNWDFGLKMNAYNFLDRLSYYFQWVVIHHEKDSICVKQPDCAYHPEVLECRSDWKSQIINNGFNYAISEGMEFGFLWQLPCSQRNAFRSSTVMLSFNTMF